MKSKINYWVEHGATGVFKARTLTVEHADDDDPLESKQHRRAEADLVRHFKNIHLKDYKIDPVVEVCLTGEARDE